MRDSSRRFVVASIAALLLVVVAICWYAFLWLEPDGRFDSPERGPELGASQIAKPEFGGDEVGRRGSSATETSEGARPRPRDPSAQPLDPADGSGEVPTEVGAEDESVAPPALDWERIVRLRLVVPIEITVGGVNIESLGDGATPRPDSVAFDPNVVSNEQRGMFDDAGLLRLAKYRIEIAALGQDAVSAEVPFTIGPPTGSHFLEVQLHFHTQIESLPTTLRDEILRLFDQHAAARPTDSVKLEWRLRHSDSPDSDRTPLRLRKVGREVRTMDMARIEFAPVSVELTEQRPVGELLVSGRFVTPSGREPVMVPQAWLYWAGGRRDNESGRSTVIYGRHNGAFVGLLRVQEGDSFPAVGQVVALSLCAVNPQRVLARPNDPESESNPFYSLTARRAASGHIDFGEVTWPGHLVRVSVDRDGEAFRTAGLAADCPVEIEMRPFSRAIPLFTDRGQPAHYLGVPITERGTRIGASIRDAGSLYFQLTTTAQLPTRSGLEQLVIKPNWASVIRVHLHHDGQVLDRGMVFALPASTPEQRADAAAGRFPAFIQDILRGYGTIPDSQHYSLPALIPVPSRTRGLPGHWVVGVVDGVGRAVQWVPISQVDDLTLELGSLGSSRRVAIIANMPELADGSIPGAAVARQQGWRGGLWFTLYGARVEAADAENPSAIEAALDIAMHLGEFYIGESGVGRSSLELDPSFSWMFSLRLAGKALVFLPLYDYERVFTSSAMTLPSSDEGTSAVPELNLGAIPAPGMVARRVSTDAGRLGGFEWRCDGQIVFADGAGYSDMSGDAWEPSSGFPPGYCDGEDVVRFRYVLPNNATESLRAEVDLPVRALVQASWSTYDKYDIEVSIHQRGMRPPMIYRVANVENGRITRVYAPIGEVTVRLVRSQGNAENRVVALAKATITQGSPVSVSITVP